MHIRLTQNELWVALGFLFVAILYCTAIQASDNNIGSSLQNEAKTPIDELKHELRVFAVETAKAFQQLSIAQVAIRQELFALRESVDKVIELQVARNKTADNPDSDNSIYALKLENEKLAMATMKAFEAQSLLVKELRAEIKELRETVDKLIKMQSGKAENESR